MPGRQRDFRRGGLISQQDVSLDGRAGPLKQGRRCRLYVSKFFLMVCFSLCVESRIDWDGISSTNGPACPPDHPESPRDGDRAPSDKKRSNAG